MIQSRIDSWVIRNDGVKDLYFNLVWIDKFKPKDNAIILDNYNIENINIYRDDSCINYIHKKLSIQKNININAIKNDFFYLTGSIMTNKKIYKIPKETKYQNYDLLKYHFKVCIKNNIADLSIITSMHMIKINIKKFIYDLIFLMIENDNIHESITTLIWLLFALDNLNFKIQIFHVEWLLGIVYILSIPNLKNKNKNKNNNKSNYYINCTKKLEDYKDIINTITKLVLYLNWSIQNYTILHDKLNNIKLTNYSPKIFYEIRPISIAVDELNLSDWVMESITPNVFPNLPYLLYNKFGMSEKYIYELIIYYYIEKNIKNNKTINDWNNIKNYFNKLQFYLLEKHY